MREILSYVVRIYRCGGGAFAGQVEQVHSGKTAPFANEAELTELLSGRRPFARRAIRRRNADDAANAVAASPSRDAG